jgi:hypothetical protein
MTSTDAVESTAQVVGGGGFLRTAEVLERYPFSLATLDRLVRDHELRAYHLRGGGRVRFFRPEDLDALFIAEDDDCA